MAALRMASRPTRVRCLRSCKSDAAAYSFCAGESVNAAAVSLKLQQHLSVQLCSGANSSAAIVVTAPQAMSQRVRFAAAASGAAALAYVAYRELSHLATRRRKLAAHGIAH